MEVAEFKYLGLYLIRSLNWAARVNYICDGARKKLWMLRRKLNEATREVKLLAYKTIIMPLADYAIPARHPYTDNNIKKCERIENVFNSYRRLQWISELRQRAGIKTANHRVIINRLKLFFQIIHIDKYVMWDTAHARTEHTKHIKPINYRTYCFKYSFFHQSN